MRIKIKERGIDMMPVITKSSGGTWLVRSEPIPFGKTAADVSVVVQKYRWGWYCQVLGHGQKRMPTHPLDCSHIDAVKSWEKKGEAVADESDFIRHDLEYDEGLIGQAKTDLTDPFDPFAV